MELLGDKIHKFMEKIGVAQLVKKYFPSCNCEGRRKRLNKWHRMAFRIAEVKYIPGAVGYPKEYAAWCNLKQKVFTTDDVDRALHFCTLQECIDWCNAEMDGTPVFEPRKVVFE